MTGQIYPKIQEELAKSVAKIEGPGLLDLEQKVPLLKAVIQESMRLYPAAWMMSRWAKEDSELDGKRISKGTEVFVCMYSLHRDPKLWERPTEFLPERFLGNDQGGAEAFSFLPFGAGPHKCVGANFAMTILQFELALILQRIKVSPVEGLTLKPFPRVALRPEPGALVKVTSRFS